MNTLRFSLLAAGLAALVSAASAQVAYNGAVYRQDFNTLPGTTNNTLNVAWTDNTTLPGWYATKSTFSVTDGTIGGSASTFDSTSATANNVGLFSFGTAGSTDRALGSRATSNFAGNDPIHYGVRLVNTSGQTITAFSVMFTGEQWFRSSANAAHVISASYQVGATSLTAGTWTAMTATFTAPVLSTTAATLDGNAAVNRRGLAARVSGLSWAPGQELWIRFTDANESGNEQGLAIDDFTFTTEVNSALFFNGATNYVTMGAATATLGAQVFTLECWMYRTGIGTATSTGTGGVTNAIPLVTKGRGEADGSNVDCNYFLGIDATTNKLVADFEAYPAAGITSGQNYPAISTNTVPFNQWTHVAATYDGGASDGEKWKLYINGVKEVNTQANPPAGAIPRYDSIQHFAIGSALTSAGAAAGFFQGIIDEVRVWNTARTTAQIAAGKDLEITSDANLLARYGLNEAAGTTVASSVAGAPNGTLTGSPVWLHGRSFTPNALPSVALTSPTASFSGVFPATVHFEASASDSDGTITKVEFYNGTTRIGEDATAPYTFDWANVAVGTYTLTAIAYDNNGGTATSTPVTITVSPNPNQPPAATLTAPADEATGIGASTALSVAIADPEGDGTTVTFYGRKTTPATPGSNFTLVAIPDTQFYSENADGTRAAIYHAETQWIVDHRNDLNVAFVSHMGDIVQNGDNSGNPIEWTVADAAMQRIESQLGTLRAFGLPWGVAPGNHDQSPIGDAGGTTTFYNQYFGFDRWSGKPYYGGHYGTRNNNNYQLFSAGGLDFIILHLEYDARAVGSYQAVLDWADAVLKAYPNRRAIVTSHWIVNTGNPATFSTQGQAIYDNLKDNPNLFLMLCGHVHGEGRRSDTFEGRTVHSVLQDYQDLNAGSGFIRLFKFSPASNQILVQSYSVTLGRAANVGEVPGATAEYTLPYDMQTAVTDWIPLGTVTVPPGGTAANLNWTGLERDSRYEWYARVSDGINTTTTGPRRFSTLVSSAPAVVLNAPAPGTSVPAGTALQISADAADADGSIARVDFFQGETKIGSATSAPYQITWTTAVPGSYVLSAVAVDQTGLSALSNTVAVTFTNQPPVVAFTSPIDDAVYDAPASIPLTVDASDPDGSIARVEFYRGTTLLGQATTAPYTFTWTAVPTGFYSVTAKAIDNAGASTTAAIDFFVTNADNVAPTVALTAPAPGANLPGGATLTATASDTDGTVARVEFYDGATKVGEDTTAPYAFDWSTNQLGTHVLTAVAIDNDGGTRASTPVTVNIVPVSFTYTQNFDGMGTGTAAPSGWQVFGALGGSNSTWTNATGIPASGVGGGTANATLIAATTFTGSSNTQGYNFALPATPADRALGTSPTSGQGIVLQLTLTNTSGGPLSSLRVGYDIRRFTAPATANSLPGYQLFYSLDGTTWTNVAVLNPALAGAVVNVPNTTGVTTVPATTINLASPWSPGGTLRFRWVDDNAVETSPDQIIGLDNVSITTPIGNPPSVALTAPTASDVFVAGNPIAFAADAADTDGTIAKVEFYDGSTKLGEALTPPYTFTWSGGAAGTHAFTAVATDNDGNSTTSAAVSVTVNPTPGSGTLTRGPYLQKASPTQMTIRWRSSQLVAGRVRYGNSPANLDQVIDESSARIEHEVAITGLAPLTTYYYSVGSSFDTIASGSDCTFTTAPTPGTAVDTRVWVLGDAGTANANQTAVRDAFYNWTGTRTPNLVLQLGDNAYNSGLDTEFQAAVFDMYAAMLKKTPFWSCLGNHETNQATAFVDTYPYFGIYTFPTAGECGGVPSGTEHYYSWDYGNIHFISLDSMTASRSPTGAMATWLQNDLASTTATWIVCLFHHPAYTKGSHNSDTETELIEMRQNILPILEAGGVDLVLSGHSHCYERSYLLDGHYGLSTTLTSAMKLDGGNGRPTGTGAYVKPLTGPRDHFGAVYSVAGSAGQISGGSLNHPAHFISLNNLGSLVIDVSGTTLNGTFLRENSATPDTFTMVKQGAADHDHDGMPDEFEIANGLNRNNAADAAQDLDGDGASNFLEYSLGTPVNGSGGAMPALGIDAGRLTLTFSRARSDLTYVVQGSDDLSNWSTLATNPGTSGSSVTVTDSTAATGPRFLRLRVTGGTSTATSRTYGRVAVALSVPAAVYDGAPKAAVAITSPVSVSVAVTYNGSSNPPIAAGSYAVVASVTDPAFVGTGSATLVIAPASAAVSLSNLRQAYDGTAKAPTAATTPAGLPVAFTYAGTAATPIYPGSYGVTAAITDPNYAGGTTNTLVITSSVVSRHGPTLSGGIDASLQVLLPESVTLKSGAWISADLLLPGTPSVVLAGTPTFVGTRDGDGDALPATHAVMLNTGSTLRYVVRRVDASALASVTTPSGPAGTRNVTVNTAADNPGDFATIRNLSIGGSAGEVTVPAGAYGTITVTNSTNAIVLGHVGATEPDRYNLQGLVLNGGRIRLVGPVKLVLATGVTINGNTVAAGPNAPAVVVGDTAHPAWLNLAIANGGLTLNGAVRVYGSVLAPAGTVTVNTSATLTGEVAADRLAVNGSGVIAAP